MTDNAALRIQNRKMQTELQADMADRKDRMMRGELDWPDVTPRKQPEPAPKPQLTQQQRATKDWAKHVETQIRKHDEVLLPFVAKSVGVIIGEVRRELLAEIKALRAEVSFLKAKKRGWFK